MTQRMSGACLAKISAPAPAREKPRAQVTTQARRVWPWPTGISALGSQRSNWQISPAGRQEIQVDGGVAGLDRGDRGPATVAPAEHVIVARGRSEPAHQQVVEPILQVDGDQVLEILGPMSDSITVRGSIAALSPSVSDRLKRRFE